MPAAAKRVRVFIVVQTSSKRKVSIKRTSAIVRFGSKAKGATGDVRFAPKADMCSARDPLRRRLASNGTIGQNGCCALQSCNPESFYGHAHDRRHVSRRYVGYRDPVVCWPRRCPKQNSRRFCFKGKSVRAVGRKLVRCRDN